MKCLSIIVPVYNSGAYLEDCLNSLVLQDVLDFEVIIVDDNSSDNSLDIIKKYCNLLSSSESFRKMVKYERG